MNVTNLPLSDRIRIYQDWVEDIQSEYHQYSPSFDVGNEIDLTPEQLSDPDYIIPEWGCGVPTWMIDERLSDKIGRKCIVKGSEESGIFLGIQCTYEDFYYKIQHEDGQIRYHSCVSKLEFLD